MKISNKHMYGRIAMLLIYTLLFTCFLPACQAPDKQTQAARQNYIVTGSTDLSKPLRYVEQVFDNVEVEKDILYAKAKGYKGDMQDLYLDLYKPAGDSASKRPAIIWIHGGSFRRGDKASGLEQMLAIEYAKKGYVTLSINYRLRDEPSEDWVGTFMDSTEDAASAVEWLVKNSEKYGVDKNYIALAGYSAGACIVTSLTYKDGQNAGWNKKNIFAVVEISGNMFPMGNAEKYDPPCAIIQGTEDGTVPYSESEEIAKALEKAGVGYTFHPVKGAGHDLKPNFYEVLDVSAKFLYKALTGKDIDMKIREGAEETEKEILKFRLQSGMKYNAKQVEFTPDGKLDEWGDAELIELDQLKDAGKELPSKDKLSGTAMIGWNENDPSHIYWAATITDDSAEHAGAPGGSWWQNSSIELIFDISRNAFYSPIIQFGFDANGEDTYSCADAKCVEWKLVKEGKQYIYEAAIDLSKLKSGFPDDVYTCKIKPGDIMGLSIEYNRCKDGTRECQIGWTPGRVSDLRNFGNILFDASGAM